MLAFVIGRTLCKLEFRPNSLFIMAYATLMTDKNLNEKQQYDLRLISSLLNKEHVKGKRCTIVNAKEGTAGS